MIIRYYIEDADRNRFMINIYNEYTMNKKR